MMKLGEDKIVVNTYCINDEIHHERMDTLNIGCTGDRVHVHTRAHVRAQASFSASFIYLFYFGLAHTLIESYGMILGI